jgi:MinD superfamily P-loop ATPase
MSNSPQTLVAQDKYAHLAGREPVAAPPRFRNRIAKYKVFRSAACSACGKCAELCPFGVHVRSGDKMLRPRDWLCAGFPCRTNEFYSMVPARRLRSGSILSSK